MEKLENEFHAAMEDIYHMAKRELHYSARRYLAMLRRRGGVETAKRLLHSKQIAQGYTILEEANRLDLTVEALVLKPEWRELFTSEELQIAQKRLNEYHLHKPTV